jgi:hypothetical protein
MKMKRKRQEEAGRGRKRRQAKGLARKEEGKTRGHLVGIIRERDLPLLRT